MKAEENCNRHYEVNQRHKLDLKLGRGATSSRTKHTKLVCKHCVEREKCKKLLLAM